MCDTENGFAKSKISLDNLGIDHFSAVSSALTERLYSTPSALIRPTLISGTPNASETPNAHTTATKLDSCELVNALSKDVFEDLDAQKQHASVDLATGQAMQMTDGQLKSLPVCNSELVNNHLANNQLANNLRASHVMLSTANSVSNNSTNCSFASDSVQSMLNQQDCSARGDQEEPSVREPMHPSANASLAKSTGNNLPPCNEAGTQSATNGSGLTNGGACSDTGNTPVPGRPPFVACTKPPNEQPSNAESASPTSQSKSTESSSPAETPKRLHVSNIPFKYHDENLRQLFSVSFLVASLVSSISTVRIFFRKGSQ